MGNFILRMPDENEMDELSEDLGYQPPPTPVIAASHPPFIEEHRQLELELDALKAAFDAVHKIAENQREAIRGLHLQSAAMEGYIRHLEKTGKEKDEAIRSLLKILATQEELRLQGFPNK